MTTTVGGWLATNNSILFYDTILDAQIKTFTPLLLEPTPKVNEIKNLATFNQ